MVDVYSFNGVSCAFSWCVRSCACSSRNPINISRLLAVREMQSRYNLSGSRTWISRDIMDNSMTRKLLSLLPLTAVLSMIHQDLNVLLTDL